MLQQLDENDNYNYEKGASATFTFNWNDKNKQLSVSAIKGNFPGMLQKRIFNVVLVNGAHGAGIAETTKEDKSIVYSGKALSVTVVK